MGDQLCGISQDLVGRSVYICETEIMLTVKEFDIFALLIMDPHRVLTYDMIIDLVWHENLDCYSHRAINDHVSNLRHKLKVTSETPDYIGSVHSIGYKFDPDIELLWSPSRILTCLGSCGQNKISQGSSK